ncbi:MAG TPA: hypothetical protein VFE33_03610 [Thermoanaerobaculia bacterium]|nr:hypothetical protein [Thermoanaerobaculia bacterium]
MILVVALTGRPVGSVEPPVCSPEAQEALIAGELEQARQGFLQAAADASHGRSPAERASCSFFLGLVAQREAQSGETPQGWRERLAEAARWYEAAWKANSSSPGAVVNLAHVYSDLGGRKRAGQLYAEALPKMAGEDRLVLARSYARFLEGEDWKKSAELYREVLKAKPTDDQVWTDLFSLLARSAPSQLSGEIWKAVEAGATLAGQQAALTDLTSLNLPDPTRVELLSALVAALAKQHYPLKSFADSEAGRTLRRLATDPAIGRGAEEILLAHEATAPPAQGFYFWAAKPGLDRRSPLYSFRSLLRSLAVRADEPLVARSYLESAENLSLGTADPLLFRDLAANYAATGEDQKIASQKPTWDRLLKQASGQLDRADVHEYRLTMEAIQKRAKDKEAHEPPPRGGVGGGGGGGGGGKLAYDADMGRCVQGGGGCDFHVMLFIPDLFPQQKGRRDAIARTALVEIGCNGRHLLGFQTSSPALSSSSAGEVRPARFELSPFPSAKIPRSPLAEDRCRRVPLGAQPAWLSSAAWAGRERWILADSLRGQLLGFGEDGALLDAAPATLPSGEAAYVRVQASPAGVPVAEDPSGHLLWRGEPTGRREAKLVGRTGPDGTLRSVFQWSLLGEDEALAVANLLGPQGTWTTAIVRLPLSSNRYEVLHRIDMSRPEALLYRAGIPVLAGVGGVGYFLALEESPVGLYRVPPGEAPQRLIAWPGVAPELRGELARDQGMAQTPDLFRLLERASLPGGLYGAGDSLFLLRRTGGGGGSMRSWELLRLDPRTGRTLHALEIPTTAHHLTVAPGEHHWAFFEKGEVTAIGHQSTPTVLLVPTSWIAGKVALAATEAGCGG